MATSLSFDRILVHYLKDTTGPVWRANASCYLKPAAPKTIDLKPYLGLATGLWSTDHLLEISDIFLKAGIMIEEASFNIILAQLKGSLKQSYQSCYQYRIRLCLFRRFRDHFEPNLLIHFAFTSIATSALCFNEALELLKVLDFSYFEILKCLDEFKFPATKSDHSLEFDTWDQLTIELMCLLLEKDLEARNACISHLIDQFSKTSSVCYRSKIYNLISGCGPKITKVVFGSELERLEYSLLFARQSIDDVYLVSIFEFITGTSDKLDNNDLLESLRRVSGKRREALLHSILTVLLNGHSSLIYKVVDKIVNHSCTHWIFNNTSLAALLISMFFFCITTNFHYLGSKSFLLLECFKTSKYWKMLSSEIKFGPGRPCSEFFEMAMDHLPISLPVVLLSKCDALCTKALKSIGLPYVLSFMESEQSYLAILPVQTFIAKNLEKILQTSPKSLAYILSNLDTTVLSSTGYFLSFWTALLQADLDGLTLKEQQLIILHSKRLQSCILAENQELTSKLNALFDFVQLKINSLPNSMATLCATLIEAIEHDHHHVVGYSSCCSECYCD